MDSEQRLICDHEIEFPPDGSAVFCLLCSFFVTPDRHRQRPHPAETLFGPRVHPDKNVDQRYTLVEAGVSELVRIFREVTPQGRELSLALTNLEQAGLWALAGIGRDKSSGGTG